MNFELTKRDRFALFHRSCNLLSQIAAIFFFGVDIKIFQDFVEVLLVLWSPSTVVVLERQARKELSELFKIVLRPLIKRVFVALGTLNTKSQERVSKTNRSCFSRLKFSSHPVKRHRFEVGKIRFSICHIGHFFAIVGVAFAGIPAGPSHDSSNHFIVGNIVFDSFMNPLIPNVADQVVVVSKIPQLSGIVLRHVAKESRPPSRVGWRLHQLVNFLFAFFWIGVGDELANFIRRWQRSRNINTDASQKHFV